MEVSFDVGRSKSAKPFARYCPKVPPNTSVEIPIGTVTAETINEFAPRSPGQNFAHDAPQKSSNRVRRRSCVICAAGSGSTKKSDPDSRAAQTGKASNGKPKEQIVSSCHAVLRPTKLERRQLPTGLWREALTQDCRAVL
jgi:hypothetical protein